MREMEQLLSLLFPDEGTKLIDLKFFAGEQPVKVEEFCLDAHSAFVQVQSGQAPAEQTLVETLHTVHVDKFIDGTH
jgi:hypothetical protein